MIPWMAVKAFLFSPLGRKVALGVAIAAAVGGVYLYGHRQGAREGKVEGATDVLEQSQKSLLVALETSRTLQAATERERAHYEADANSAKEERQKSDERFVQLAQSRAADHKRISGLTEDQALLELKKGFGLQPTDALPAKEMLDIVHQFDNLQTSIHELQQGQAATDKELANVRGELGSVTKQRDDALRLNAELVGKYTEAFNAAEAARRRRGWKCLGLWKCSVKQMTLPAPITLQAVVKK